MTPCGRFVLRCDFIFCHSGLDKLAPCLTRENPGFSLKFTLYSSERLFARLASVTDEQL